MRKVNPKELQTLGIARAGATGNSMGATAASAKPVENKYEMLYRTNIIPQYAT